MARSRPKPWHYAVVLLLLVGPLVVSRLMSRAPARAALVNLFDLPKDADFRSFSAHQTSGRDRHIQGVVQLTDAQYRAYERTLNDRTGWQFEPFTFGNIKVTTSPSPDALRWYPMDDAVIVRGQGAIRWVDWGFS